MERSESLLRNRQEWLAVANSCHEVASTFRRGGGGEEMLEIVS